jgi:hypothetical protein
VDTDDDGVADSEDNCPEVANPDQEDTDEDGVGDACDPDLIDTDEDGVVDSEDNCPEVANPDQEDADGDGIGDACEETGDTCFREGHPVAEALADEFEEDYDTIMGWHCEGFGFGEIARALLLAEQSEEYTAEDFLQMKADGLGWGQIKKEAGVSPSDLAPGRVIRHGHAHDQDQEEEEEQAEAQMQTAGPDESQNGPGNSGNAPRHNKDKNKGKHKGKK